MNIIEYKTIAGQFFPCGSIGKSDWRLRIQNTTKEEFQEYAELLEKSGYSMRVTKEISAGRETSCGNNLFYTYQNEEQIVFMFWNAYFHTVFITVEPICAIPPIEMYPLTDMAQKSTLTQMQIKYGMSYVVRLCDGEFIIVDGGTKNSEDMIRLYAFLKENSPYEIPRVALWIFTHSHEDHIGLATDFLLVYKGLVKIKAFSYQFPNCDKIQVAMENVAVMKRDIEELEKNIASTYPNAIVYPMHTGQSYFFPGLEIEILYSLDDTYSYPYLSFNDTSVAFRMKFNGGKSILFLGDCMQEACMRIAHTYGDYLNSDIMQLTHHGLIGGDKGLYQLVNPEICLWSITEERFSGRTENQRYQWCLGEGGCDYNAYLRDKTIRERKHYTLSCTTTVYV